MSLLVVCKQILEIAQHFSDEFVREQFHENSDIVAVTGG